MRCLIDTHVLIWYLNGDKNLRQEHADLMYDSENQLYLSIVSIWEITIKMSLNKLDISENLQQIEDFIDSKDYETLNISFGHLKTLSNLFYHHRDPFDRLLISQAITENLTIISADEHFKHYPVNVIW